MSKSSALDAPRIFPILLFNLMVSKVSITSWEISGITHLKLFNSSTSDFASASLRAVFVLALSHNVVISLIAVDQGFFSIL